MQSEEAVEVQRPPFRSLVGRRGNSQARALAIVVRLAVRDHHVHAIGSAAEKDVDQDVASFAPLRERQ